LISLRSFKIKKAVKLLRETITWRKEFGLGDLHEGRWKDEIKTENATGKSYIRGYDKEGHILVYLNPSKENTRDHKGNMRHLVYTMERAIAAMKHTTGGEKLSLVIDYTGYTMAHAPTMKSSKETLTILQNHYPERLFRAYAIRPPSIFHTFLALVSPFIDSVTKKKICLIKDSELAKLDNRFFADMDRSVLETAVGGLDDRAFVSETYLNGPFELDYGGILDALAGGGGNSEKLTTSSSETDDAISA
jgi:hypothetical protein